MYRRHLATAVLVAAIATTATACNGDDQNTTDPKPSSSTSATAHPAPQQSSAAPHTPNNNGAHTVGSTLTLNGKNGEQAAVTLKGWADPAKPDNKYLSPSPGKRWVAAQLEFVNTGTSTYSDSPSNGVKVVDAQGQTFTQSLAEIAEGPTMPGSVNLAKGEKVLGWVVFAIPTDSKPQTVQVTLDSGFGKQTGEWTVAK